MFAGVRRWLARASIAVRPAKAERELAREVAAHLALLEDEYRGRGMNAVDARVAALHAFGGVEQAKQLQRDARSFVWVEDARRDIRHAVRTFARNPGFTTTAIVTLALGIGATTAMFTLLYAGTFRELPVRNPEQLVFLEWEYRGQRNAFFSYPHLERVRTRTTRLSGVALISGLNRINVLTAGTPGIAFGELVSGDYFRLLGIHAHLGRLLGPDDDRADATVAVLSYALWQRRFGGDPAVIGQAIVVNGVPLTVIGVTPREFAGVAVGSSIDVRMPLALRDQLVMGDGAIWNEPWATWLLTIARLKPGISPTQATAELTPILRDALSESPEPGTDTTDAARDARMHVVAANTGLVQGRVLGGYIPALRMLIAVAGLVLLIACANLAHLLLARAATRRTEMEIRLAIGATRARLVRQLLTESLLVGTLGGVLGLIVAFAGSTALIATMSPVSQPITIETAPDLTILGFAALVSVAAVLVFGVAPAFHASRVNAPEAAKGTLTVRGGFPFSWSKTMLSLQLAICVIMLFAAGLFVRSARIILARDAGFTRDNVLMFSTDPSMAGYTPDARGALYSATLEGLRTIPGVSDVATSYARPIDPEMYLIGGLGYAGGRTLPAEQRIRAAVNVVSPGYFSTLEVPVLSGRDFGAHDLAHGPKVAIINETLARQLFPEGSAVGRRIGSNDRDTAEIVGIVRDTIYARLSADVRGILYFPVTQRAPNQVTFLLRYSGEVTPIANAARARLRAIDSTLPMFRVNTLNQEAKDSIVRERLLANASSLFGVIALLVASVGLYGAMSLAVTRRNKEIAVRMALGADQRGLIWMVLGESLTPVLVGGLIGLPTGYLLMRFARTLLFGIEANDPATMAGAAVVLLAVAASAAYLPARRAARVEPIIALRSE